MMKKSFQLFLGLFGLTAIFIASLHIVFGPSVIPGSIPVNASMDSEDRFYATLFAAYGVALLWCMKDIERKSMPVYFLALTFLAGGLARLVSMAAVGLPNTFFLVMTVLELLIPFFIAFMQWRIAKAAHIQQDTPSSILPPLSGSGAVVEIRRVAILINGYFLEKDAEMRQREMVEAARLERLIQEANGSRSSRWQKWTRRVGAWLIGLGHWLKQEAGGQLDPLSLD